MATLAQRITDLAAAIRDKFNAINPRLVATGGITGYVYTKTPTGHGWAESVGGGDSIYDIAILRCNSRLVAN